MIVNATKLAEIYNVDPRTITNWVNASPPCPSWTEGRERKFDTSAVTEWREQQAVAKALAQMTKTPPDSLIEAERRRAVAEALQAEIKAAKAEGSVIPLDVHEEVVGELGDRVMAVVQNVPDTYSLDLERAGIPPREARAVLERIQQDLVVALRGAAEAPDEFVDTPQD